MEGKAELEEKEQQIRQNFRMNKEFGQLSREKITKWLDKATKEIELAEEPAEERDYRMDEFDRLNPFDEKEFRPDAETPPPPPPP